MQTGWSAAGVVDVPVAVSLGLLIYQVAAKDQMQPQNELMNKSKLQPTKRALLTGAGHVLLAREPPGCQQISTNSMWAVYEMHVLLKELVMSWMCF